MNFESASSFIIEIPIESHSDVLVDNSVAPWDIDFYRKQDKRIA